MYVIVTMLSLATAAVSEVWPLPPLVLLILSPLSSPLNHCWSIGRISSVEDWFTTALQAIQQHHPPILLYRIVKTNLS